MKRPLLSLVCVLLVSSLLATSVAPFRNPDGGKWRFAYAESGYYIDYHLNFQSLLTVLMEWGWIEPIDLPELAFSEEPLSFWKWACKNVKSDYIELLPDAGWSYRFDDTARGAVTESILRRLNRGDVDILLSMGTWASQELANNRHNTPTFIISTSDPVGAGIIESAERSGFDHVTAHVDPDRYMKQIRMFHDIFHFSRLGIVYEDTPAGRSYAALDDVRHVAEERGFELVEATCRVDDPDFDLLYRELRVTYEKLAPQVDAMYLTANSAHTDQWLPILIEPFASRGVPTFSQTGANEVEYGVLLCLTASDPNEYMRFTANKIVQTLQGAKPGDLPQVIPASPRLAINLEMCRRIGWDPPIEILKMCDNVFSTIPATE